jgi:hypothetical protein
MMQLEPMRPPGRATRKAWQYAVDIQRLRAEGYSLEAIRLALLDAGVAVSVSTVRREAARHLGAPAKQAPLHADAGWEVEDVHRAADPISDSDSDSDSEAMTQMIAKFFEPLERPVPRHERPDDGEQRENPPRSVPAWLTRLLQGVRRTG